MTAKTTRVNEKEYRISANLLPSKGAPARRLITPN